VATKPPHDYTRERLRALSKAAHYALHDATEELQAALTKMEKAATQYMHACALASDEPMRALATQAALNSARWSGGPGATRNLQEAALRDAALALASRPHALQGPIAVHFEPEAS